MSRALFILLLLPFACSRPRPVKIGVVNMKVLMDKSVWGRKHQKAIQTALASREKQWEHKCGTPIKELTLKITAEKKKGTVPPALEAQQIKLSRMCYALKRQYHQEVEQINEAYAAKILKKVKETTAIIGRTMKLDLVVTLFRGVVLYGSERVDITERVVVALEEEP